MPLEPAAPRYQLEQTIDGLRIAIAARRNWFMILFLSAWLGGWTMGEVSAIGQLASGNAEGNHLFLVFWLAGWTLGGAWAMTTLLWSLFGKEIVTVGSAGIAYRVEIFGLGRTRSYASNHISGLRPADFTSGGIMNPASTAPPFFGEPSGPIAFDYGADTVRLGRSLTEAEARLLMTKLRERLPAPLFQQAA